MKYDFKKQIDDTKQELENIKKNIDTNENKINIVNQYLTRYSVIKATSTIEQLYKNILFNNVSVGINEYAKNFLNNKIMKTSLNPNFENIKKNLTVYSGNLEAEFKKYCSNNQQHIDNLNTLVKHRNSIAHGENISSDITIDSVIKCFESGINIISYLNDIL